MSPNLWEGLCGRRELFTGFSPSYKGRQCIVLLVTAHVGHAKSRIGRNLVIRTVISATSLVINQCNCVALYPCHWIAAENTPAPRP